MRNEYAFAMLGDEECLCGMFGFKVKSWSMLGSSQPPILSCLVKLFCVGVDVVNK